MGGGEGSEFLLYVRSSRKAAFEIMCASLLMLTRKTFMLPADAPCLRITGLLECNR